jgi:hypothetical protein
MFIYWIIQCIIFIYSNISTSLYYILYPWIYSGIPGECKFYPIFPGLRKPREMSIPKCFLFAVYCRTVIPAFSTLSFIMHYVIIIINRAMCSVHSSKLSTQINRILTKQLHLCKRTWIKIEWSYWLKHEMCACVCL